MAPAMMIRFETSIVVWTTGSVGVAMIFPSRIQRSLTSPVMFETGSTTVPPASFRKDSIEINALLMMRKQTHFNRIVTKQAKFSQSD
jgi:hypothetical protein